MMTPRQLFFRHLGLPGQHPMALEIDHAEGIYLYDTSGRTYIDLVSGVSVSNLGHRHPAIVEAIREQADKYTHLMVYGEFIQAPQVTLAKELSECLPDRLDCTFFVNSGSEAIDGAIKLARRFTGRTEIAAFRNAYHGGTYGALSILGNERLKSAFRPLLPDIRQLEFNDINGLSSISRRTACVVAETVQAEAGIILPQEGFLQALRQRCDETGTLLVMDDIQMGMGRTGKLFSFEHFGIEPDILALAKAFGGGMPLGAFISSGEIMRSLANNPELGHITTFGGHPVSCAAALASLRVLKEEKPYLQADRKGRLFNDRLASHRRIGEIRQAGLMLGVEMSDNVSLGEMLRLLTEKGIIVDPFLFMPNAFRIAPPLIITDEQINEACDRIIECLNQLP